MKIGNKQPATGRSYNNVKVICIALCLTLMTLCGVAVAQQQGKTYRVGYIANRAGPIENLFKEKLRSLGYNEGKNLVLEQRFAQGQLDRLPAFVTELVQLKVDVIVVTSVQGTLAAKKASRTIPIVFAIAQEPVETGIVTSLARPGGNLTGLTDFARELAGKRIGVFKQAVPALSRLAILSWKPAGPDYAAERDEIQSAARALQISIQPAQVTGPKNLDEAFRKIAQAGADGFIGLTDTRLARNRQRIVELTIKNKLPAIFQDRLFAEAGGLLSYGTNRVEWRSRLANYVDKILKGAKPADLPVERPTEFELVINLKTAKQIGLTIPPSLLARADRVIR